MTAKEALRSTCSSEQEYRSLLNRRNAIAWKREAVIDTIACDNGHSPIDWDQADKDMEEYINS
jgi:hypothetical protein